MVTSMMETYFEDIVDVEFTAGWRSKLDKVEEGKWIGSKVLCATSTARLNRR